MKIRLEDMRNGAFIAIAALVGITATVFVLARTQGSQDGDDAGAATEEVADISEAPSFTPYTVAPAIANREEVMAALEREYPPLLRDAGIGGRTLVWLFIDEEGVVQNQQVNTSSGHEALDEAAMRVASVFEFSPAMNEDEAVPVWIALPITFSS